METMGSVTCGDHGKCEIWTKNGACERRFYFCFGQKPDHHAGRIRNDPHGVPILLKVAEERSESIVEPREHTVDDRPLQVPKHRLLTVGDIGGILSESERE